MPRTPFAIVFAALLFAVGCHSDDPAQDAPPFTWDTGTPKPSDSSTPDDTAPVDGSDPDPDSDSEDIPIPVFCREDADCDDRNPCTLDFCDERAGRCDYSNLEMDGQPCDDGLFCNGSETCQGGECVSADPPCADAEPAFGSCIAPGVCDEERKACLDGPVKDGTPCSEPLFCLGDQPQVCLSGVCHTPEGAQNPCDGSCHGMQCREDTKDCRKMVDHTGQFCYGGSPCERGVCDASGACADQTDPCLVQYGTTPCYDVQCRPDLENNARPWRCDIVDAKPNMAPCSVPDNDCYGGATGSYCYTQAPLDPQCISGPHRPCMNTGIDEEQQCTPNLSVPENYVCVDLDPPLAPVILGCGYNAYQNAPHPFRTRSHYAYNATCAGDFPGAEAVYRITGLTAGQTVTVTADHLPPGHALTWLRLGDYTDPTSCVQAGANTLSFTAAGATADLIAEAGPGYPPASFLLTVTCD
ncbi:MAG: hypothetical protein GX146_00890 [Myxococcales bacterium]|jgi:hypothetical protein|nr:hypothetical protein [Myxococcales bacterium]